MKVKGNCPECGKEVELDASSMPPEDCGGRDGFFSIDQGCPECGEEIETVIRMRPNDER